MELPCQLDRERCQEQNAQHHEGADGHAERADKRPCTETDGAGREPDDHHGDDQDEGTGDGPDDCPCGCYVEEGVTEAHTGNIVQDKRRAGHQTQEAERRRDEVAATEKVEKEVQKRKDEERDGEQHVKKRRHRGEQQRGDERRILGAEHHAQRQVHQAFDQLLLIPCEVVCVRNALEGLFDLGFRIEEPVAETALFDLFGGIVM